MNLKHIATALAAALTIILTGCAATDATSDFGKISTTGVPHSTDPNPSGEMGGIGFVSRY